MRATTTLPETRLIELRAAGHAAARRSRFVDPSVIYQCSRVLDRRGEIWAASVLGRDLSRRSLAVPSRPYLLDGEPETLVAADRAEDEQTLEGIASA